ncbi:MAG: hypothetical protein QXS85_05645 [Acidilobaceae archaeon]
MGVEDLVAAANLLRSIVPSAEVDLGFYSALLGLVIIIGLLGLGLGFITYRVVYEITHQSVGVFLKFVFALGVFLVILSLLLP